MDYKTVQQLCIKSNIEFENKSYSKLIKQLKEQLYNPKRHKCTQTERETMYNESKKLQKLLKTITIERFSY